jgi:flagellar hook-basal body complex protein FliE
MDMRIAPLSTPLASPAIQAARAAMTALRETRQTQDTGFGGALKGALQSVSAAQNESVGLQKEVQMENPAVSLEETMVAIQKAQIGFQATVNVRNRMVQAYTDIMNMQV